MNQERHSPEFTICDYMPGVYPITGRCSMASPCPGADAPPAQHGSLCRHSADLAEGAAPSAPPAKCKGGDLCPIHGRR